MQPPPLVTLPGRRRLRTRMLFGVVFLSGGPIMLLVQQRRAWRRLATLGLPLPQGATHLER